MQRNGFSDQDIEKIKKTGRRAVMSWLFETSTGQTNHHLELSIPCFFVPHSMILFKPGADISILTP